MTLTVRSQGKLDLTGNPVFGQGLFDNDNSSYLLAQTTTFGTAKAVAVTTSAATVTQTLYLTEAGTTNPISVTDINQGQLGDCFLLSSIGEEALFHPTAISNMIHNNGNGTETVTLYVDKSGALPGFNSTSFKAVSVTINNVFSSSSVNNQSNQAAFGNVKEIWPQVLEKALATLNGGYNTIANGGYPSLAMEELTGKVATSYTPSRLSLTALQQYVAAGDLITFDTSSSAHLPANLVSNHCYMFQSLTGSGSSTMVHLLNPWGTNQPAAIAFSQLAQTGIVQIDVGRVA